MDKHLQAAHDLIADEASAFLKQINAVCENGPFRKARKLPSTFSMFRGANDEFYEYAYFERTLEWYIRDLLINPILRGLLAIHGVTTLWPEKKNYIRFSTEAVENVQPFEFVIETEHERVGIRYSGLDADEATEMIARYKLTRIIRIRWDEGRCNTIHEIYEEISPEDFFALYQMHEVYKFFCEAMCSAVQAANEEIGFNTIPNLSLRYLSDFKAELDKELRNLHYASMRFQILPGAVDRFGLTSKRIDANDHEILHRRYITEGRYKALLGTEGFAKCFITAEYQYQVFKQGHRMDYTSIACGYLKAIEQLLYKLLKINLKYPSEDILWIKRGKELPKALYKPGISCRPNPSTGKPQVVFAKEYEAYFDITMAPMAWFIHDNLNGWEISSNARITTHSFLRNYGDECRNDHFHKDNIDDFDVVTCIRNNTLLLCYLLLGGYKHTGSCDNDLAELGVFDDSFDRLYKQIQKLPRGITKFIIQYANSAPIKAYRHFDQAQTVYDEEGTVMASAIRFVEVDGFSGDEYEKAMEGAYAVKEFSITQTRIPESIGFINGRGEVVPIEW